MNLFALDEDACRALAARHGTPLFAYRADRAATQLLALRKHLPDRVRIAYAVKANPHPALLSRLADLGMDFDCASGGELRRVLALSGRPGRISYAGPGKREPELALALAHGVRIQAEGIEDLERIERLAATPVDVNLRVHPATGFEERRSILGGSGASAFGIDEEDLPDLLVRAERFRNVRLRGLHVFAASNELDADRLLASHARVFALARHLRRGAGITLTQINLGGGLGVPYRPQDAPLDTARLGAGLAELLTEHEWFRGELVLEPGRFIAAPCGVYLAEVVRVKVSRGRRFVILDGGINHLLRPLLTGEPFPVRALVPPGPVRPATLAGPLCTGLDRLGEVELPDVRGGDLLCFGMAGAYGFSEAMPNFLSHGPPPEIWV